MTTPAQRSAQYLKAISITRKAAVEAKRHADAQARAPHVLDLGVPDALEAPASPESPAAPIEAASSADFSDRLLRALFGQWPPADQR